MDQAAQAPTFQALTQGLAGLQACLERLGQSEDRIHVRIPAKLGETIEAELMVCDPQFWLPLTSGIEIHADGHLKQFVLCESIWVGWKTGSFRERKKTNGQPFRADRDGV